MRAWRGGVVAGLVGSMVAAGTVWAESPKRGPARVLELFPKPVEEIQPQARERAVPTVVHNLTKNAREAKSGNAANRPPAAGRR